VTGLVERPLSLGLRDLQKMRSHTRVVTLECAGNGRTLFNPPNPFECGIVRPSPSRRLPRPARPRRRSTGRRPRPRR
jgi:DMSO/TMAO reductase YedYZ molybdopterin-dependent catalytic subunit